MTQYSEQDLRYAEELREEIHKEALAIVRKTRPFVTEVIDRHPVEDYFQEMWDYPGKWYTIVAIPYGYKNRKALVDSIVRDTLSEKAPEKELIYPEYDRRKETPKKPTKESDPFYMLLAEYPDLVVDYYIVENEQHELGYKAHHKALKAAYGRFCKDWEGDPNRAVGTRIEAGELFSPQHQNEKLGYRKAFLYPPHQNSYTGKDFVRVNAALFPNGTDALEVYEWTTDWSEYFDDGREWWGTLCLTVYDKTLDRFAVIMASATD